MKKSINCRAVKAAVSFDEVLKCYGLTTNVRVTRNGHGLKMPCPFHLQNNGKDTFVVNRSGQSWYCHCSKCKRGGNHFDFVRCMENCSTIEAALIVDTWFNLGLAKIKHPRFTAASAE